MKASKKLVKTSLLLTAILLGLSMSAVNARDGNMVEVFGNASATPVTNSAVASAATDTSAQPGSSQRRSIGQAVNEGKLANYRGGTAISNSIVSEGTVNNTSATNVATGSNSVTAGSFANASGFPTVIQNTGANVLIQNATIVNVQFK
jgi:hypothetical protein